MSEAGKYLNGSHEVEEMACILCERIQEMIMNHIEFVSFDELCAEISWIEGDREILTGRAPSCKFGTHLSSGGECLAPFENTTNKNKEPYRVWLIY